MADRDGDGWVRCAQGHRHWGRYGAAGLLAYVPGDGSGVTVLLQRRNWRGNHPGTWGPPGGARDSHESAVSAALREAAEECDLPPDLVRVTGILRDDHGGWSYQTITAAAREAFAVRSASAETSEVGWVPEEEVGRLALHPGFAAQWPVLRASLLRLTVIVDVANVMGSRADGWWRDRAGAAVRLHGELVSLAGRGVPGLPASMSAPAMERWFPCFVLVLEGAARSARRDLAQPRWSRDGLPGGRSDEEPGRSRGGLPGGRSDEEPGRSRDGLPGGQSDEEPGGFRDMSRVRVVAADGSGDDLIADLAARTPGHRLVVTADRDLRSRCAAAGASVTGPRWLLGLL